MLLTGQFEHVIDAKARLAVPSQIRSRLTAAGHSEAFYAVVGSNGNIWLWPEKTFERIAGDIEPELAPTAELLEYEATTFPDAHWVEIDKAGRVRLPADLLEEAGIDKKVVILGMRNRLELCDPSLWRQRRRDLATRRKDIAERARPEIRRRTAGGGRESNEDQT